MTTTDAQANARLSVDAAQQKCFVCDKEIVDGRWFCKVFRESKRVVLCCPRCALRYFETLHPTADGDERNRAAYEQSLHFLVEQRSHES